MEQNRTPKTRVIPNHLCAAANDQILPASIWFLTIINLAQVKHLVRPWQEVQ